MAGRGLFNKLVDTFNTVADDARRQLANKDVGTKAPGDQEMQGASTDTEHAVSHMEGARQMASDSGRRAASDSEVGCKFCGTPLDTGKFCTGCGAAVDR